MSVPSARLAMRWLMAAFYLGAGLLHLRSPDAFLPIVPGWVPAPREVVLLTGVGRRASLRISDFGSEQREVVRQIVDEIDRHHPS